MKHNKRNVFSNKLKVLYSNNIGTDFIGKIYLPLVNPFAFTASIFRSLNTLSHILCESS